MFSMKGITWFRSTAPSILHRRNVHCSTPAIAPPRPTSQILHSCRKNTRDRAPSRPSNWPSRRSGRVRRARKDPRTLCSLLPLLVPHRKASAHDPIHNMYQRVGSPPKTMRLAKRELPWQRAKAHRVLARLSPPYIVMNRPIALPKQRLLPLADAILPRLAEVASQPALISGGWPGGIIGETFGCPDHLRGDLPPHPEVLRFVDRDRH